MNQSGEGQTSNSAQGHTKECRIRVEGELRKTEGGKARLRAAASRVGDTLTRRALKRVRFAEDQDDNNAEVLEPTSETAPPNLPAETASSSSAPTPSVNPALPVSATEVPDHVMTEGASSSSDAAVSLSLKLSSDNPNSESEAKRLHTDHSMRDAVMLLDDSDVSHEVERWTFLVDVNDWDCEPRDNLRTCGSDGTTVVCSSGGVAKELTSNESRLLDFLAAARNSNGNLQRKTIAKYVRQHKCRILGAVGHCEEFDPTLVHRATMEEKDFINKMGVYDVVPRSDAAEKGCRVVRTRRVTVNNGSDNAPQLRARWVAQEFRGRCGDKHEYFSETSDLALVKAVIAHAARPSRE